MNSKGKREEEVKGKITNKKREKEGNEAEGKGEKEAEKTTSEKRNKEGTSRGRGCGGWISNEQTNYECGT